MNRIIVGLLGLAALALGLAGCAVMERAAGKQYRTDYLLESPSSAEGLRCTASCEQRRNYCRTKSDDGHADTHKQCEEQARNEYDNCVSRTTSFSEKTQCYRKSCPVAADYVNCESTFRACFEGCGGQVWTRQVCEARC